VLQLKNKGIVTGLTLGVWVAGAAVAWGQARAGDVVDGQPAMAAARPLGSPQSFAEIFAKVSPAVVSIDITGKARPSEVAMQGGDGGDDDNNGQGGRALPFPLPLPFGSGPGGQGQLHIVPGQPDGRDLPKFQATGSGFFIAPNGYILTNNHVVQDAITITVRTSDGKSYKAHLVGRDPATDIAVVKVDGEDFPYVTFEESAKPRVGDWVVAVGNPFGLGGTATAGIISALGREDVADSRLIDYMQIDAPINRGNSGGPTFDVYGRVVGVNTAIYSPSGGSVGIGFDIPADVASSISRQLISAGKVSHGFIGATIQQITPDLSESMGMKTTDGALIAALTDGGPAERAGLKVGDVVLGVNGHTVKSASDLTRQVAFAHPDDVLQLSVLRDGHEQTIAVRAGLRPSEQELAANGNPGRDQGGSDGDAEVSKPVLGMRLAPLSPSLRQQLNLSERVHGVVVAGVNRNSDAADKGLQPGDVIVKAGDRAVTQPSDMTAAVADARADKRPSVPLLISRGGHTLFVPVKVGLG
jgi:serine protease Do